MNRDPRIATYFDIFCPQRQKTYHKSGLKKKTSQCMKPISYISLPRLLFHVLDAFDRHNNDPRITGSRALFDPGWAATSKTWVRLKNISLMPTSWCFCLPICKNSFKLTPPSTTYDVQPILESFPKKNQGPYFKAIKSLGHFFSI